MVTAHDGLVAPSLDACEDVMATALVQEVNFALSLFRGKISSLGRIPVLEHQFQAEGCWEHFSIPRHLT